MTEQEKMDIPASRIEGAEDFFKEDYLEHVFENSADAIGIMDKHGMAIRWNKTANELFGYTLEELKKMKVFDLYPDKDRLEKMLAQLRRNGLVRKFAITVRRKDGHIVPFEMSISLLKDKNDHLVGSVGTARDLSDIRRVMAELKVLKALLQFSGTRITAGIHN